MTPRNPEDPESIGQSDYPAKCGCGRTLLNDEARRAHCGTCREYDGTLTPVSIGGEPA